VDALPDTELDSYRCVAASLVAALALDGPAKLRQLASHLVTKLERDAAAIGAMLGEVSRPIGGERALARFQAEHLHYFATLETDVRRALRDLGFMPTPGRTPAPGSLVLGMANHLALVVEPARAVELTASQRGITAGMAVPVPAGEVYAPPIRVFNSPAQRLRALASPPSATRTRIDPSFEQAQRILAASVVAGRETVVLEQTHAHVEALAARARAVKAALGSGNAPTVETVQRLQDLTYLATAEGRGGMWCELMEPLVTALGYRLEPAGQTLAELMQATPPGTFVLFEGFRHMTMYAHAQPSLHLLFDSAGIGREDPNGRDLQKGDTALRTLAPEDAACTGQPMAKYASYEAGLVFRRAG
jgi:hypothetical protein